MESVAQTLIGMKREDLRPTAGEQKALLAGIDSIMDALKDISLEEFYAASRSREGVMHG